MSDYRANLKPSTPKKASNADLKQKYSEILREPLVVHDVIHCNHRPHPYMVGTRHVVHAADHCGGMLGETTMRAVPCAWKGCTTDFDGHSSDRVLVIRLLRDVSQEEVKAQLTPELGKQLEESGVDGITFLEGHKILTKGATPC